MARSNSSLSESAQRKVNDALRILDAAGIDVNALTPRRRHRLALAFLALSNIRPDDRWSDAAVWSSSDHSLTSREAITFWNTHYGENISSGSYDDVRRKEFVLLREAGLAIPSAADPGANTNNPTRRWAIAESAGRLTREFGTARWPGAVGAFVAEHGTLADRVDRHRNLKRPGVVIRLGGGTPLNLSPGPHNDLQRRVVEEFFPRFAPDSEILYIGDTTKKILHRNDLRLAELGFFDLEHGRLPDIVAFDSVRNWILLVEAVHSSNPMTSLRHLELERLTTRCTSPRVYVSAFATRAEFRRWITDIAWETEVWIADVPEHLVHFDGEKFLGPYLAPD